jgi:transposase-like protein
MQRLLKHKLVIGLVAVLVAASGGAAYAATQTGTDSQQALLKDVAKRLNVSPSQLRSAVQGALLDRLQAAVKAGQLTQAQANRIKQRIQKGALPIGPLGGGGFWLHRPGLKGRFGPPGQFGPPGRFGPAGVGAPFGPFAAAAKYLGISVSQLLTDIRGGKTVAQIAQSHGKSVSGLEQAIGSAEKTRLDALVSKGFLTKAQEQRRLNLITRAIDRLVEHAHVTRAPSGKTPPPSRPGGLPPGLFGSGPAGPPTGGPGGSSAPASGPGRPLPPAA